MGGNRGLKNNVEMDINERSEPELEGEKHTDQRKLKLRKHQTPVHQTSPATIRKLFQQQTFTR